MLDGELIAHGLWTAGHFAGLRANRTLHRLARGPRHYVKLVSGPCGEPYALRHRYSVDGKKNKNEDEIRVKRTTSHTLLTLGMVRSESLFKQSFLEVYTHDD